MIKQVLFDCGGVLVELKFREFIKELSGSDEVAEYFKNNLWSDRSPWLRYDKGELNSQEVAVEMKKFIPAEYHEYLERFLEDWIDALPPMPGMEEIVDELQAKLDSRDVQMTAIGSIAEASLLVSGVFEAAQKAAGGCQGGRASQRQ